MSDCLNPLYRATTLEPGPAGQSPHSSSALHSKELSGGGGYDDNNDDDDDLEERGPNRRTHAPTAAPCHDRDAIRPPRRRPITDRLEAREQMEEARENVRREAGIGNMRTFSRRSGSPPSRVVRNDRYRAVDLSMRLQAMNGDRMGREITHVQRASSRRGSRQAVTKVDGLNEDDRKEDLQQGFKGELLDHQDRKNEDASLYGKGKTRDIPKGPRPMPSLVEADAERKLRSEEDVFDSVKEPRAKHGNACVDNNEEKPRRRGQPKRVMPKKLFG
ncbi:MAG: hypothetical protein Q9209_002348 [Squamulea sp. 1 TL-2023]